MLTSEIIRKAVYNDEIALSEILLHYSGCIKKECCYYKYDKYGNPYTYFDEEKEARLYEKIVCAIKKFKCWFKGT